MENYVLEAHENAPLIVSFAFNHNGADPTPYMDWRLNHIEQMTGKKLSKLYLQDMRSFWYQCGADGTGQNANETASFIRNIASQLKASSITTLGESMGGYAALSIGILAEVDSIIAFAPISFFNQQQALQFADLRYIWKMLESNCLYPTATADIGTLANYRKFNGKATVAYGMQPELKHVDSTTFDAVHAWRIKSYFPSVNLEGFPQSGHLVAAHLKDIGLLDKFLIDRIPSL
ncbi:MAG: hypothetical protein V4805_09375 [Pseudomonadota bacterium]